MKRVIIISLIFIGLLATAGLGSMALGKYSDWQNDQYLIEQERIKELESLKKKLEELENRPAPAPQIIEKTITVDNTKYVSSSTSEIDLSSIISEWTPRVAFVVCAWKWDGIGTGSATLAYLDTIGIVAMTNRHVINSNGYIPNGCIIKNSTGKYAIDWTQGISNYSTPYFWDPIGEDYGYVRIDKTDTSLTSLVSQPIKLCTNPKIGDKLVVLGYPGIGSHESITATEGIISGIEQNYYVTSAKIEHGNSGGAAILLKENCYLGIPSASQVGEIESLGRILKASFVIKNR